MSNHRESAVPEHLTSADHPLLEIRDLVKVFAGNRALDGVSVDVRGGEVLAVLGHNGSGKSTLVKILAGVYELDGGTVELAADTDLHVIHQDLGLAPELTTVENLSLPKHRGGRGWLPFRAARERAHAQALIARFGASFNVTVPVESLAPGQRAIVAIARSLDGWSRDRNVLILDEPTEALHASEVSVLLDAVRSLASEGTGVIFISHRLDEVLEIADRIVVLRDGAKVADQSRDEIDHDRLVELITGGTDADDPVERERRSRPVGATALQVRGLSGGAVRGVDLQVGKGEIVGIAGVLGSGREDIASLLFGARSSVDEGFTIDGVGYERRNPHASIAQGMAFVPGDRAKLGSIRPLSARENVTLNDMGGLTGPTGSVSTRRERREVEALIKTYDVRPPSTEQQFSEFSGGNQQKLVFAKWLRTRPTVLLLDEPTQGVDIGAKQTLYHAIDEAAEGGAAVVVCSSDAKELVRLCDRVLVLRDGLVGAELTGAEVTEMNIITEGYGLGQKGQHD